MRILRILLAVASLVSLAMPGTAATFSVNQGGLLAQSSVIDATAGPGVDYTSLKAAADDFNSFSGGAQLSYSFLIRSDLTEPVSVAFGNATNGHTVTVKPDTGSSVTVTFTAAAANAGAGPIQGDLIIGTNSATDIAAGIKPTDGFVIDGSNNGSASRNLTLARNVNLSSRHTVIVIGNSDNVTIKNASIFNRSTGTAFAVNPLVRGTAYPDNLTLDNNWIQASASSGAQAIQTGSTTAGGAPAVVTGTAMQNFVINNNDIIGGTRAVFLNINGQTNVTNNRVGVNVTGAAGFNSYGIWHLGSNGTTGWTTTISGNRFTQLSTNNNASGAFGITAIECATAPAAPGLVTYNVVNNIITGFAFTNPAAFDQHYRGIVLTATATAGVDYNVFHNSINMPTTASVTGVTPNRAVGIHLNTASPTAMANVRNNIVSIPQVNGIALSKSATSVLVSADNDLYVGGIGITGRDNTTNYATLGDWQASAPGRDAGSVAVDPTVPTPPANGKWISNSDLHFNFYPGVLYEAAPVAGVTTDIDGETRSLITPTMGADEVAPNAGIREWSLF